MIKRMWRAGRETLRGTYLGAGTALSFLTFEVRSLQAAAYILALSSLVSSILALLRDRLLAHFFGAGIELDVYYAAFRIPDMVFIGVGALVSAYMLIPELSRRTSDEQKSYLDTVVLGFSVLVSIVGVAAAVAAPFILQKFFSGLVEVRGLAEITTLTRILLMQAVLLGFSNIAAAITQFKHRYALYAASPIVYNLGIIMGAVVFYPHFGLPGLVWGVVLGAALHLGIQLPSIIRDGFVRSFPRTFDPGAFMDTVKLSFPRALALSMNQLAFFGLLSLAGAVGAGSISVFMFGYNLQGVPLSIIGASYATAAFPTLAYAYSRGESKEFFAHVCLAARQILFWSLPLMALIVVLRAHMVRAILGSGAFDWTDTRLTAAAFALFALSLAAQGLTLLLIRAFYASGRTLAPFLVSSGGAILTVTLGVVFLQMAEGQSAGNFLELLLRVEGVPGSSVLVLALAYAASSIISLLVLILYFEVRFGNLFSEIRRVWWQGLAAAFAAGATAYVILNIIGDVTFASTLASILLKGTTAGLAGCSAAVLVYYLLGSRELAENVATLRRRMWREAEPVASAEHSA